MAFPVHKDEAARLAALRRYDLLDSPAEPELDQLVSLVAQTLDVPIALISLVDAERQWFKAKVGLDAAETSRDVSFCTHAVAADSPLIVNDATLDDRFRDNALVLKDPSIRFYAGIPLHSEDG